jgi:HD superfamily phosphohydrolase
MIVSDPVHGTIEIPDKYRHILATRPLARLRNVRQLGFTPSVYTGAVHTRYEHTLGKTFVLMNLLDQFRITDPALRERLVVAALMSEIGSYPLSHSTTWLFADKLHISKRDYARQLCDYVFSLSSTEKEFIWGPSIAAHAWFTTMPAFSNYPELTVLRLAGDIDYALRDAHYSGRYINSFDYRYFQTLVDISSAACQEELAESVRELYRSIYALNSVYGDPLRRFITLILARLTGFLIDQRYLDVERYRAPAEYLELDDDRFIADISLATQRAYDDGYAWVSDMFDCVKQVRSVEIQRQPISDDLKSLTIPELERTIASVHDISDANRVVAMTDTKPNAPKYVLFGRTFDCYSSAVGSDYFYAMTGLEGATNRTGLWDERYVFFTIV